MVQSDKLQVQCEEESDTFPHCAHGPMLFFYKKSAPKEGYFACSALRDRHACLRRYTISDLSKGVKARRATVDINGYKKLRRMILSAPESDRRYCHTCSKPYLRQDNNQHIDHEIERKLSDDLMVNPTYFLNPMNNDKAEAQYFFDDNSLKLFATCLETCNIRKLICIGAPRLHGFLKVSAQVDSFLLDFDQRYFFFYDDDQFAWYNMCNNHFFDDLQKTSFERFLQMPDSDNLAIFTDPPFGCRTEVIANTMKQLTFAYRSINHHMRVPAIFWVFPYFSERYTQEMMPEMEMSDYKVNYTNHNAYSNGLKGRKLGSPARLYTNVPLDKVVLPPNEGYKYCQPCHRWTAQENVHCHHCKICPSKNGDTYRHCPLCRTCVKPNYIHCGSCQRCSQKEGHDCVTYQQWIRCWNCRKLGHNESTCPTSPQRAKFNKMLHRRSHSSRSNDVNFRCK